MHRHPFDHKLPEHRPRLHLATLQKITDREQARCLPPTKVIEMTRKKLPDPDDIIGVDLLTDPERRQLQEFQDRLDRARDHRGLQATLLDDARLRLTDMQRHLEEAIACGDEPLDLSVGRDYLRDCKANLLAAEDILVRVQADHDDYGNSLLQRRRQRYLSRRAEKIAEVDAVARQLELINRELAELDREGGSLGILQPATMGWLTVKLEAWRIFAGVNNPPKPNYPDEDQTRANRLQEIAFNEWRKDANRSNAAKVPGWPIKNQLAMGTVDFLNEHQRN